MTSLFIAAGMPRSGSTWLYNAMRLLLRRKLGDEERLTCGWIEDLSPIQGEGSYLVKIHNFDPDLSQRALFVAWSFRDLRDAIASQHRKFGTPPTVELADHFVNQHNLWAARANYLMRYEDMVTDPIRELRRLGDVLHLSNVEPENLIVHLSQLSRAPVQAGDDRYDRLTLFHDGHITDGRVGSWTNGLSADMERVIAARHRRWLEQLSYEVDAME